MDITQNFESDSPRLTGGSRITVPHLFIIPFAFVLLIHYSFNIFTDFAYSLLRPAAIPILLDNFRHNLYTACA